MVYQKKFVAVVKVNGQVLRERDDNIITLPFGCEYSIYLKNLNSRKCSVKIWIDDQDILFGKSLIIDSNCSIDLERFIRNDYNAGNKFKFIQKTKEITDFRGDRPEDGIIRIEYVFEKEKPDLRFSPSWVPYGVISSQCTKCFTSPCMCGIWTFGFSNVRCYNSSPTTISSIHNNVTLTTSSVKNLSEVKEDEGITVPGSISNQQVKSGYIGQLENNSEVLIIRLKGFVENNVFVEKIITVKDKLQCVSCGLKNDSSSNFCKKCGTSLNII